MSLTAAILILASGGLSAADSMAIDLQIAEIYRPYSRRMNSKSAWERPIFTAEINALVWRWGRVTRHDEVDDLSDGDWLCLCQDWTPRRFRATVVSKRSVRPGSIEAALRINLGEGSTRTARLQMKREGSGWKIDDMFSSDYPHGLKQALRETIAADEKLPK
ncbi:MAG: DUF3828 domain-containing protein [Novosphingobium sp.]